jgi:hypothetical protein
MITIERHFGWPTRFPTSKKTGTGSNAVFRKILAQYPIGKGWVDPMCGRDSRCEFRNDIRARGTTANHVGDALAWLESLPSNKFAGAVYDPPYNDRQGEKYTKLNVSKSNLKYWWALRRELGRIVKPGGTIILFAWNTNSFPDCKVERVWVVAHGSDRNDTLVSVHRKKL